MRWVLFDLIVGATLVWLLWSGQQVERTELSPHATVTAVPSASMAPALVDAPTEASEIVPEPARSIEEPAVVVPADVDDRGRRLRALARDAEALFLRGDSRR